MSNEYSVGVEMHQESDGGVYEATLNAAATLASSVAGETPGDEIFARILAAGGEG